MTVWNLLGSFAKETGQRIFAALRNAATFYEQVEDWKGAEVVDSGLLIWAGLSGQIQTLARAQLD